MRILLRKHKWLLLLNSLLCLVTSGLYVYLAIILKKVTNIAFSGDISEFSTKIIMSIAYFIVLSIVSFLFSFTSKFTIIKITQRLKKNIFTGVLRRNNQDYNHVNTADYISALTNDVKIVEENLLTQLVSVSQGVCMFFGSLVTLFIINYMIALVLILVILLMFIVPTAFGKSLQKRQNDVSTSLSGFTVRIKDLLSGYEVIKSYNMQKHTDQQFDYINQDVATNQKRAAKVIALSETVAKALALISIFSGIFVAAYFVVIGSLTPGTMIAVIQLSSNCISPLQVIMEGFPKISSAKMVLKRLEDCIEYEDHAFTGESHPTFEHHIHVENLSFSYDETKSVLNGIDLKIEKGKKYGIVGKSGCGKSTLIKLLSGNYYNYEGNITFDNKEIRNLNEKKLLTLFSTVHQSVYMFDDNIKENICLYDDFPEEQLARAIITSGVDGFLPTMPEGMDYAVGENGNKLSGGQRQRIAVARALIRNQPILIMDEGTSSIDRQTAFDIESGLLDIEDLTVITVTHNLNEDLLEKYDEIIFMENGRISAKGHLNVLLKNSEDFTNFCSQAL